MEYGKGGHLLLMIITGLTVGPILVVYITILLAGRPLQRINILREYLRPVYEAIHAPYKRNREFVFTFNLIILVLYIIDTCLLSNDVYKERVIGIPILSVYLLVTALLQPFNSNWFNALNWVISIIIIIFAVSVLFPMEQTTVTLFASILHSVVLLIVIAVILYHIPSNQETFKENKKLSLVDFPFTIQ